MAVASRKNQANSASDNSIGHIHINNVKSRKNVQSTERYRFYENLLDALMTAKNSNSFLRPVAELYVKTDIPGYHDAIKTPMDLGTIANQLKRNKYIIAKNGVFSFDGRSFIEDLRLVYRNCMTYNSDGTPLHTIASGFLETLRFIIKLRRMQGPKQCVQCQSIKPLQVDVEKRVKEATDQTRATCKLECDQRINALRTSFAVQQSSAVCVAVNKVAAEQKRALQNMKAAYEKQLADSQQRAEEAVKAAADAMQSQRKFKYQLLKKEGDIRRVENENRIAIQSAVEAAVTAERDAYERRNKDTQTAEAEAVQRAHRQHRLELRTKLQQISESYVQDKEEAIANAVKRALQEERLQSKKRAQKETQMWTQVRDHVESQVTALEKKMSEAEGALKITKLDAEQYRSESEQKEQEFAAVLEAVRREAQQAQLRLKTEIQKRKDLEHRFGNEREETPKFVEMGRFRKRQMDRADEDGTAFKDNCEKDAADKVDCALTAEAKRSAKRRKMYRMVVDPEEEATHTRANRRIILETEVDADTKSEVEMQLEESQSVGNGEGQPRVLRMKVCFNSVKSRYT